ncbi:MAG: hypothetical protein IPJ32_05075 [Sphingobacteriaceae bacterium]|nr:hypothetical protein [Sphingobacteriaceae bacterium]
MSSLFSYELDEAQIRLTLQNSRTVEYNESDWDEFERNFIQNNSNQNLSRFKLPEFNLNINRNVVLPVVFIAALVGVSAIMLSFVDFKTNAPTQIEKGLIPNPNNYKPEQTKTTVVVKKEPVKTVVEKPIVKADSVPVKAEAPPTTTTQVAVNTNTSSSKNQSLAVAQNTQARIVKADTGSVKNSASPIITSTTPNSTGHKRKRRRKVPTDQIETIKAPSLLGQQETATKEPELELKLN